MVKYSENLEDKLITMNDHKVYLENRLKGLAKSGEFLSNLFETLEIVADELSVFGVLFDIAFSIVLVVIICLSFPTEMIVAMSIFFEIFFLFILACIGSTLSITKMITEALSSKFSQLSEDYKKHGHGEKCKAGLLLFKRLSELHDCYKFEELYVALREKYPDRQIRFIKRKSEDDKYQALTLRLEQIYADPDSVIVEEDGALCKEFDFLIRKSLFKKIFGETIDFTAIDQVYSKWQDDLNAWVEEDSPEVEESYEDESAENDEYNEKEEGLKELSEHLISTWDQNQIDPEKEMF